MRTRFIANSLLVVIILVASCSDKYISLQRIDVPPVIVTDKDSMTIRERDFSNYNRGAGFIRVTAKDSLATGMNIKVYDSTGHLQVFYDSAKLVNVLPLNQATVLFIACKDTGYYPLTIEVTDKVQQVGKRVIPVNVVANQIPETRFTMRTLDYGQGRVQYLVDASGSSSKMGRIVSYTYKIDSSESTLFVPTIKTTLYSGEHIIGVVVTDDLGAKSILKTEKITVL